MATRNERLSVSKWGKDGGEGTLANICIIKMLYRQRAGWNYQMMIISAVAQEQWSMEECESWHYSLIRFAVHPIPWWSIKLHISINLFGSNNNLILYYCKRFLFRLLLVCLFFFNTCTIPGTTSINLNRSIRKQHTTTGQSPVNWRAARESVHKSSAAGYAPQHTFFGRRIIIKGNAWTALLNCSLFWWILLVLVAALCMFNCEWQGTGGL